MNIFELFKKFQMMLGHHNFKFELRPVLENDIELSITARKDENIFTNNYIFRERDLPYLTDEYIYKVASDLIHAMYYELLKPTAIQEDK